MSKWGLWFFFLANDLAVAKEERCDLRARNLELYTRQERGTKGRLFGGCLERLRGTASTIPPLVLGSWNTWKTMVLLTFSQRTINDQQKIDHHRPQTSRQHH